MLIKSTDNNSNNLGGKKPRPDNRRQSDISKTNPSPVQSFSLELDDTLAQTAPIESIREGIRQLDNYVSNTAKHMMASHNKIKNKYEKKQISLGKASQNMETVGINDGQLNRAAAFWLREYTDYVETIKEITDDLASCGYKLATLGGVVKDFESKLSLLDPSSYLFLDTGGDKSEKGGKSLNLILPDTSGEICNNAMISIQDVYNELKHIMEYMKDKLEQVTGNPENLKIKESDLREYVEFITTQIKEQLNPSVTPNDLSNMNRLAYLVSELGNIRDSLLSRKAVVNMEQITLASPDLRQESDRLLVDIHNFLNVIYGQLKESTMKQDEGSEQLWSVLNSLSNKVGDMLEEIEDTKGAIAASLVMKDRAKGESKAPALSAYKALKIADTGRPLSDAELYKLFKSGKSKKELASLCGVTYNCIANHLRVYEESLSLEGQLNE